MRKLVLAATLALCVPLLSMSASAQRYGGPEYGDPRGGPEYRERNYRSREGDYRSREGGYGNRERDYGAEGPGVVIMGSTNANTCAVIPTFANRSCAGN